MEERITSRRNPLLAHTKKLLTSRSYREKTGEFAADGVKLLAEAARWYPGLTTVIAEDGIELCKLPEQSNEFNCLISSCVNFFAGILTYFKEK